MQSKNKCVDCRFCVIGQATKEPPNFPDEKCYFCITNETDVKLLIVEAHCRYYEEKEKK